MSLADLDDVNQTCVCIPYTPDESTEAGSSRIQSNLNANPFHDFPDGLGVELRRIAYEEAWSRCLARVKELVDALQSRVVRDVLQEIRNAHSPDRILPGLPYAELPVVCLVGGQSSSAYGLLEHVLRALSATSSDDDADIDMDDQNAAQYAYTTHISPSDAPNLQTAMKTLVQGFVKQDPRPPRKRKAAYKAPAGIGGPRGLAAYDLNFVRAWYDEIDRLSAQPDSNPNLVVFVHEFEAFDTNIMKDVWEICAMQIPRLPLVFVLSPPPAAAPTANVSAEWAAALSTPPYLLKHFPRAALALIRVRTFTVPGGLSVAEHIVMKTFYSPFFSPSLVLGPGALDFLVQHVTRTDASLDGVITILQLAHMKHFDVEPLSALAHATPDDAEAAVRARLGLGDDEDARAVVEETRIEFRARAWRFGAALGALGRVRAWMVRQGYKSADPAHAERAGAGSGMPELELALRALRTEVGRDVKWLGMMARKVSPEQLPTFLEDMGAYFDGLGDPTIEVEGRDSPLVEAARLKITAAAERLAQLLAPGAGGEDETMEEDNPLHDDARKTGARELAREFGEWLFGWIEEHLAPLTNCRLWEVWYTGSTPFPSELINPAPRASVVSALLDPQAYLDAAASSATEEHRQLRLWELPDTSILFRGYLDAGRMINAYDWYGAFASVLDEQRENRRETGKTKGKKKGKGKGKQKESDGEGEPDGEQWKMETHARFIRALHELDHMGFIKHTGRKADHVIKTVYEVAD